MNEKSEEFIASQKELNKILRKDQVNYLASNIITYIDGLAKYVSHKNIDFQPELYEAQAAIEKLMVKIGVYDYEK